MNDATNASEHTQLRRQIDQLSERNTKLAALLKDARVKLQQLLAEVDALAEPASTYGVFLGYSGRPHDSRRDAEVYTNGRVMRVKISPNLEPGSLKVGQQVRLGEGFVVVEACSPVNTGSLATLHERIGTDRAVITNSAGEEQVVVLAAHLRDEVRAGDTLLIEPKSAVAAERVHKTEVAQLTLEEVPDVSYDDIGGLDEQISQIRDSVELPFPAIRSPAAQRRAALWSPGMRQDPHCQGCGAFSVHLLRHDCAQLLPQRQGPGAAQQVCWRNRAPHPTHL